MVAKKRHPRLGGLPVFRHQSRDGSLGNYESEFQQLTVDARGSPEGIGGSHGSDQLANLKIHSRAAWPSRLGQSPPVVFESPTMPPDHCLRLNEFQRRSPIFPDFLERNPKQSISIAQSWSLLLTCEDRQLLTKRDIFQGDLLVTTEDAYDESNHQQK